VKLVKHSDTGKDVILQVFVPGDMFGETALFDHKPYATSAQAMEPSTILKLSRKDFFYFFGRHPFVATEMIMELGRQLREAHNTIKSLAVDRVRTAPGQYFDQVSRKIGRPRRGRDPSQPIAHPPGSGRYGGNDCGDSHPGHEPLHQDQDHQACGWKDLNPQAQGFAEDLRRKRRLLTSPLSQGNMI